MIDVLVGTFVGDTGAYLGGRAVRRDAAGAADLAEQDRRGPRRSASSSAIAAVWFAGPLPGLAHRHATRCCSALGVAIAAPIGDLFESLPQARRRHQGHRPLFGAHGGALDRFDAALFAVVAGYYVWSAMS